MIIVIFFIAAWFISIFFLLFCIFAGDLITRKRFPEYYEEPNYGQDSEDKPKKVV